MPTFDGRFEFLAPGRGAVRSGGCQLTFDARTVTLVADGPSLAFDLGDIDAYEPGECQVRLSLFNGHDLVLTRFAKAFSDMERQLRAAYRDRLVRCLLVSDLREAARFTGRVTLESPVRQCAGPAEIRLYESNLAVLPDAGVGFQWRLADVDRVGFDEANYAVTFVRGGERLSIGRLAKRTGELADRARSRLTALKERSARALHAVFPFLGPEPFVRAAAAMPEGRSVSIADLGAVHPLVQPALLETVVDSGLRPYVSALAGRAASPWFAGFKVIRQEAPDVDGGAVDADDDTPAGTGPTAENAATADGPGDATIGEAAVGEGLSVGEGLEVLFWYFFPLAAGGGAPSHLAWEATTRGGRATYVFRLPAGQPVADGVGAINRGLVSLNFRREPIYLDDRRLETDHRYRHYAIALRKLPELAEVRRSLVGRAIHTSPEAWARQLEDLLAR
jgi:hypothetical protein